MNNKIVLVLFCVIGVTLAIDNKVCEGLPNGTGFVNHPDPTKCFEYISCFNGVAFEKKCPDGFYHDKCKQTECNIPVNLEEKCLCEGAAPPQTCPKEGESSIINN
jgi:hypothetical protein